MLGSSVDQHVPSPKNNTSCGSSSRQTGDDSRGVKSRTKTFIVFADQACFPRQPITVSGGLPVNMILPFQATLTAASQLSLAKTNSDHQYRNSTAMGRGPFLISGNVLWATEVSRPSGPDGASF